MADSMPPDPDHLRPFIDRIAIIAPIKNDALAEGVHSSIWTAFSDKRVFSPGPTIGGFRASKRIALEHIKHNKKRPLLHYGYTKTPNGVGLATKFRIEFSPVDLNQDAMLELHAILMMCVDGGWEFFVKHGIITILEVTVDVPGVEMGDFHVMLPSAPSMRAWSSKGEVETVVFGSKKGNQYRVYDRGKKRKAKGQVFAGPVTTRIERILRGPKLRPKDLPFMMNPFEALSIVTLPPHPPPQEPSEKYWKMFCDSVAVRNLTGALPLLAEKKRAKYRKWFKLHGSDWWHPELFWQNWKADLKESKLVDEKAWH